MCTTCGCASGNTQIEGHDLHHGHAHAHDHDHTHSHAHDHAHSHSQSHSHAPDAKGDLHYGRGAAGAHAPGLSQRRMVQIEQDILSKNDRYAAANREKLAEQNLLALNLVSSPGSGKTTLLTRTIEDIGKTFTCGVIEGDQQTANDADRIRATGAKAVQINTGKGCHLDAHMVGHALEQFDLGEQGVLFIENVGNLVCPAAFDLGEAHKVAILSVTEGEDKPLKYPDMFHAADLMILNKVDLLPYLDFDVAQCIEYARRVNPEIQVLQLSARTGEGMQGWYAWIEQRQQALLQAKLDALESQVASLKRTLGKG
ncbi:hydrogenase nickel incorporation protein HypB [Motiliproteus sp. SC1-56]|uniref:hydrogenase nickel incorporation protein HypB n=1 Tax=Motiliproteus sp. SC1-56 TaxID=2799565 RepID=UPI001A8C9741|nr:hydrogenase nickel incorporation protein HypB [Motiliproteus sp. SC1-56]